MPSYSVVTFGCQMNMHDSSRMEEVLERAGYAPSDDVEQADVVVLNTCSIREKAEHKLRSEVGRLGVLKRRRPDLIIGVAGCVAQQEGERLLKDLPQIDLILGPDNIPELPRLLAELDHGGLPQVRTVFDVDEPSFLAATPTPGRAGSSAFVTVMKGCNERCSYCIVPTTRGPERYRGSDEIVAEIQRFVAAGVREITLLGQTVNSYLDPSGRLPKPAEGLENRWKHTRGALANQDETEFPELLRRIVREVPELWRLRYTSPHPRHLTSSLIRAHQELPQLCRHLHLPVQSGSDPVLKRMIRRYSAAEYLERIQALKEEVPGLTLSSDVIVGFPGETDEDFERTLELARAAEFVAVFGFTYSQRPFTPALKLVDDVSEEEKGRRLARLFAVVDESKNRHLASLVGREELVLIEGTSKQGNVTGRSERNEIVHLLGASSESAPTGALVRARIQEAFKNSLAGELLAVERAAPEILSVALADRAESTRTGAPKQTGGRRALPVLGGA
ncbi:MAG TPA: MiaB/RimO family radical SAM methylthiotransferase [Polyangiaceae bacterium]|nr:MiaB/RimO family radical SAM methylthiotransferase [Polyangiaceae bacterium]